MARTVLYAAAAGSTTAGMCVPLTATGTSPATVTTTLAFALLELKNQPDGTFLTRPSSRPYIHGIMINGKKKAVPGMLVSMSGCQPKACRVTFFIGQAVRNFSVFCLNYD